MIQIPENVKHALYHGRLLKNYKMAILDDYGNEHFTIDSHNLKTESVKIDERLCSSDTLKFGLCEGSSLSFSYFDMPDISGRHIRVDLDVQYRDDDDNLRWFTIPMGFYEVSSCVRDGSTGLIKCEAFNKLKSEYLDTKINPSALTSDVIDITKVSMFKIMLDSLRDYQIIPAQSEGGIEPTEGIEYTGEWQRLGSFAYNGSTRYVWIMNESLLYTVTNANRVIFDLEDLKPVKEYAHGLKEEIIDEFGTTAFNLVFNAIGPLVSVDAGYRNTIDYYPIGSAEKRSIEGLTTTYAEPMWGELTLTTNHYTVGIGTSTEPLDYGEMFSIGILRPKMRAITTFSIDNIEIPITDDIDATIREVVTASYELQCKFGQLDRIINLFDGRELNYGGLSPQLTLAPNTSLVPRGAIESANKSHYKKLYTNIKPDESFKYLIITYKTLDENGNEAKKTLQRTVNEDGTQNYNMSDNWLMRNFTWTNEQVGAYADTMVEKMRPLRWFPFEMESVGLPYLETGDMLEILTDTGSHPSYMLRRSLKGIQNLEDDIENGEVVN